MLWAKGKFSVIYNSNEKSAIFLNHDKKEGQWILTQDSGSRRSRQNLKTNNKGENAADVSLKEIEQGKTAINNWIYADQNTEAPLILLHLLNLDNSEISNQINMNMSNPITQPGLSTSKVKFNVNHSFLGVFGNGKSSTFGEFKANNYTIHGLEMIVRSRNDHLSKEDLERHEKLKKLNHAFKMGGAGAGGPGSSPHGHSPMSPGANSEDNKMLSMSEAEFNADMKQVDTLFSESATKYKESIVPKASYQKLSYENYLNAPHPIEVQLGNGRTINSKVKRHPVKGKVSLSEDFPISKNTFLKIFSAAAPKFRHFQRLQEFMEMQMPEGFPVHIDFPIMATISAELTALDLKIVKEKTNQNIGLVDESMFVVPKNYVIKQESEVL